MQAKQIYSSSSGNLYLIAGVNGDRLLIEIGVTWDKIKKALNYDLSNIVGAISSHYHLDHFREPLKVMDSGIDVYASNEAFDSQGLSEHRRAKVLTQQAWVSIGSFDVLPFLVNHDCEPCFGFIIRADDESMIFATDTSHLLYKFRTPFKIVMLECSYNKEYLQKRKDEGSIHEKVAKRLLMSHMEEAECLRTLRNFLNLDRCEQIHLIHCSADHIHKKRLKAEFEKELMIEVKII